MFYVQQIVLRNFIELLLGVLPKSSLDELREATYLHLENLPSPDDFSSEIEIWAAKFTNEEWRKYVNMVENVASAE